MSRRGIDCSEADRLWERIASGQVLEPGARARLEDHLARCRRCANLERALETIRWSDDEPPIPPLDDVTAHRLVTQAVDRVFSEPAGDLTGEMDLPSDEEPHGRVPPGRTAAWVAAGALGVLGVLAALVLLSGRRLPTQTHRGHSTSPPAGTGLRCLMTAGAATQGRGMLRAGEPVAPDRPIEVSEGSLVVALSEGSVIRMAGPGRLTLHVLGTNLVEVDLERGVLDVFVAPGEGPHVSVAAGRVRATVVGTFARIRDRGTCAWLGVLHGIVAVQTPSGVFQVAEGQSYDGCRSRFLPISPGEAARLASSEDRLHVLTSQRPARLVVRSDPVGAEVFLDGTLLGRTPLEALVRPGHWKLAVRHGSAVSKEYVTLSAGQHASRFFVLGARHQPRAHPPRGQTSGPRDRAIWRLRRPPRTRHLREISKPAPARPLAEAFARARALRSRRLWKQAAAAYRTILLKYGSRPEAKVALVSLGLIELEHLGRPRAALRHFRAYLASGGSLSEEASWGVIRALVRLGRRAEASREIQRFLARYPTSLRAARAKSLLESLSASHARNPRGRDGRRAGEVTTQRHGEP